MKVQVSDLRIGKIKQDYLFLNDYLLKDGKEDRQITNTPHYKLLVGYEKDPNLDLKSTDYYRFAKAHFDYFGRWFHSREKSAIITKMRNFLKLYDKIKREGYDYKKGRIIVFKTVVGAKPIDKFMRPHPPTPTYIPTDYEIYEGHHRAAILAKLGCKEIDVDVYSQYVRMRCFMASAMARAKRVIFKNMVK